MSVVINGTTGVTSVNGTAGAPSMTGTDTDTGIVYGTNTLSLATGGTTAVTVDSSQNVGIGTSSPSGYGTPNLHINGTTPLIHLTTPTTGTTSGDGTQIAVSGVDFQITNIEAGNLVFGTSATERLRIDSSGNLLVGTTSTGGGKCVIENNGGNQLVLSNPAGGTGAQYAAYFLRTGSVVGSIQTTNTATSYVTSSDYRLKENISPMIGALAKVAQLKPVAYTWKTDGSAGQGFIAHELQEVVSDAVVGEKDAVDADGNPVYQGIDTSFLVATLTAAIQEQQALITQLQADVAALKGQA